MSKKNNIPNEITGDPEKIELYDKINSIMDELYGICLDNKIPMMATYAKEYEGKTSYENRVVTPLAASIELSNDKITSFNAALNNDFYLKVKRTPDDISIADAVGQFFTE